MSKDIKKDTKAKKTKKAGIFDISIGSVTLTQKALFAKHMSVMLKAGLTITDALFIAVQSSQGKLRKILIAVIKSVQSGNNFSDSLSRFPKAFGAAFVSATEAGESSGKLDENLDILAKQLEKEKELSSKVKGAMLYPIVVLTAAFVLGMAMSFLVLPKIIPLFEGMKMDLPFTTRGLIWFSHFVNDHGTGLLIGIFIFVFSLFWIVRQKFAKPVTNWLILNLPVIKKISHNSNIARFCRTLGMLLQSGINIDEALEITQRTMANYYYRSSMAKVVKGVGTGSKLSQNLSRFKHLYPIMVINMVKVGEESGNLEETLLYLADFHEVEVDTATKSLATIIEPVLLLFIGLIVGFLALSIITPIYNITGNISK
ncbi:MAG: type II secretion system F family protein [bacterium]